METGALLGLVLFVLSCLFVGYMTYDVLSFLLIDYFPILVSISFVTILIAAAVIWTIMKYRRWFWKVPLQFLQNSYTIIFSFTIAYIVYLTAASVIIWINSFQPTFILVFSVFFPYVAVLSFSVLYFKKRFSNAGFSLVASVSKSVIISLVASTIVLFVFVMVDIHLLYSNAVAASITAGAEKERFANYTLLESSAEEGPVYSEFLKLKLDPEVINLQVYRDFQDLRLTTFAEEEKIYDETLSLPDSRYPFFDAQLILKCISYPCYERAIDMIYGILKLAVNAYGLYSSYASITSIHESVVSGFDTKDVVDKNLETIASQGKEVILFDKEKYTMQSYLDKVQPYVEENYMSNTVVQFPNITKPNELLILNNLTQELPIGSGWIFSLFNQNKGSISLKLFLTSKFAKGIGDIAVLSYNLYSRFKQDSGSYSILYENRNADESLESKFIRYKILYGYLAGKQST